MELQEIIKEKDRLFIGEEVPKEYLTDPYIEKIPDVYAVALPTRHEEVVELVKFAKEKQLTIIARGAGTGVAGAQVPIHGQELIIDVKLMNRILGLDEETFTLTVEPGVLVGDIHQYVESLGYFYPPDPASKHSSIGGNVATNAGGIRAVKYGVTRDYVREMTVVLPSGEEMTLGSLNIKSSSGYDLLDLFIGSEGTLGITTEIKLRLLPLPEMEQTMLISFEDVFKATEGALAILASGANPSEIELFEKEAVYYAEEHLGYPLQSQLGEAYLLVALDGNNELELKARINTIINDIEPLSLEILSFTDSDEARKAKLIRDNILIGLMEFTQYEMLDEVVPINKFAELIHYTKGLQEKHGLRVLNFGHSGDGNVHTILMRGDLTDEEWQTRRKALLDDLYIKVKELGGLPSAEHGIGTVKKPYLEEMTDDVNLQYMRKIKEIFDPENRLNPGKLF
ncbi:MAG TPA: FAD-binding oxidoreductase [Candidatus Atopostipes pullistercoris]|uniref:FAD-binding oxidoreductase n=1 Tax=Candidatus Atopostipes pullistercoris TaxID=2838467 RepID=A0A9D2JY45_9LACT|nr:FAD-binding oxidoreductase [Candidatus Atopostipes pullistercoris]